MALNVKPSFPRAWTFSWQRVARLARKELREILRDRRTIVTLIAMPLLLYPLMSVAFQQFYLASRVTLEAGQEYRIGVLSSEEQQVFERRFRRGQRIWRRAQKPPADAEKPPALPSQLGWYPVGRRLSTEEERAAALDALKEDLREGKIDLILEASPYDSLPSLPKAMEKDELLDYRVYYVPSFPIARAALFYVEKMLAIANEDNLRQRLNKTDVTPHITLIRLHREPMHLAEGEGVISLASLVPLILILMTITGAVYPAIDLTAGERERGTLEILVAAPVSRFELLSAKYVSVVIVAILNALVNLVCMSITVTWSGLGATLFQGGGLSLIVLLQVFALLLLFAAFFSAVLLCLTSFARSFKEAQAYLIPLMLASLTPGIMAMMPGLKLQGVLAVLPLVNIVLLARDLFDGKVDPVIATLVIVTTLLYALAALSLAARVFGAESVLYSEQSSWADLVRRPDEPQPAATIPAALWCLALMVPIQFTLIALVRTLGAIPPAVGIVLLSGVNLLLFGALPALFLYLGRVEFKTGLGLFRPHLLGWSSSILLGFSLWPLELYWLAQSEVTAQLEERFGTVLDAMQRARASIGWGVLLAVIVPAILEELFFRGLLYAALIRRCSAWLTILLCGLLFGITHVVLDGALGLERFLPSALLGLILSLVRWRTGSLWPCLILHVAHNTILLTVALYSPGSTHEIPLPWLAAGTTGTLVAAFLLWLHSSEKSSASSFHS